MKTLMVPSGFIQGAVLVALLGAFPCIARAQDESAPRADACALPPALRAAVQARFGSSTVLKSSDLFEDERRLFLADHKAACPGMTKGAFFGPKERPALALILRGVGPEAETILVVARPALSSWTFLEVERLEKDSTAVVWKGAAGPYEDRPTGKTVQAKSDVLILTGFESWQRVYIWNGQKFEMLQLAD